MWQRVNIAKESDKEWTQQGNLTKSEHSKGMWQRVNTTRECDKEWTQQGNVTKSEHSRDAEADYEQIYDWRQNEVHHSHPNLEVYKIY
jgi:hypothetical protein